MGFPTEQAWKVSDAPAPFTDMLTKAIVGLEIEVTRIEGKGKWGQEIKAGDQMGCIRGFEALGADDSREMARQIKESLRKDEKRVGVLTEEACLVQGQKVKGPFGWFHEAVDNVESRNKVVVVVRKLTLWIAISIVAALAGLGASILLARICAHL
jgi:hypothetical protein